MKRKIFSMPGVFAVLLLILGLVQVQQASALDNNGFFVSPSERDVWLLKVMASHPFYYYSTSVDQQYAQISRLLVSDNTWLPSDDGSASPDVAILGLGLIFKRSPSGSGGIMVRFFKTKEDAEASIGFTEFGTFEAGSTDAARKTTATRIVNSLTKYVASEGKDTELLK
jgi:hypothetical protein